MFSPEIVLLSQGEATEVKVSADRLRELQTRRRGEAVEAKVSADRLREL